jgi:hypothetical protein
MRPEANRPLTMLLSRELLMRRVVALVLIVAVSGCSAAQPPPSVPPAPAEVCAQPGLWAVYARTSPSSPQSVQPRPLPPGKAAGTGALAGAAGTVAGGTFGGGLLGLAFGIVLAPVAAIVGAGVGLFSAHSEADIVAAEKNLTGALDAAKPADAIRARVVALAHERAGRRMYDCADLDSLEACERQSPEPPAVVLSMTASPPYFEVEGRINPDLRLLLSADAEIVRTSDGATVYRRAWVYRGRQHGYFDFAADDAKLFRAELQTATDALAAKAVDDLLIGGREEVHTSSEQPEGTVWTVLPPGSSSPGADCP